MKNGANCEAMNSRKMTSPGHTNGGVRHRGQRVPNRLRAMNPHATATGTATAATYPPAWSIRRVSSAGEGMGYQANGAA
jgi:hypothetical protein